MHHKRLVISLLLCCVVVILSLISVSSYSLDTSQGVVVNCKGNNYIFSPQNFGNSMGRALYNALKFAGSKSSDSSIATVTVPQGEYKLDRTLKIYSNTTFIAENCSFTLYDNMLSNGYDDGKTVAFDYNGAKNITVIGGIWNMNVPFENAQSTEKELTHSTFRFAHCKNIVIKNCTFLNNYNCHDIELGGVSDVTIENCIFENERSLNKLTLDGGREALQIDINTEVSVPYFKAYDKTTSKNITISNNTFRNKARGIGSHHGIIGKPYDNIIIKNNNFYNISGAAIYMIYTNNVTISDNVMNNVGVGIDLYSVSNIQSKNLLNPLNYSYTQSENTVTNSTIKIYNNTIKIRNKNNKFNTKYGIRLSGSDYAATDTQTNIKSGTYYIHNVNVVNNIVTGYYDYGIVLTNGAYYNFANNQAENTKIINSYNTKAE